MMANTDPYSKFLEENLTSDNFKQRFNEQMKHWYDEIQSKQTPLDQITRSSFQIQIIHQAFDSWKHSPRFSAEDKKFLVIKRSELVDLFYLCKARLTEEIIESVNHSDQIEPHYTTSSSNLKELMEELGLNVELVTDISEREKAALISSMGDDKTEVLEEAIGQSHTKFTTPSFPIASLYSSIGLECTIR